MRNHIGLILFFVLGFAVNGRAQNGGCPGDRGGRALRHKHASVFLVTDRPEHSLAESIVIDVGIRNDGPDPLYVYRQISWGYGGGLVLKIRDQSGKEIEPPVRDDTMLPPPHTLNDPSIFVELTEGNFYGTRRVLPVKDIVRVPGRYTLQVEYNNPLSCAIVDPKLQQLPALWHEDASIFSNTVSFVVSP